MRRESATGDLPLSPQVANNGQLHSAPAATPADSLASRGLSGLDLTEQARSSISLTLMTWETPERSPQQLRTSLCTQQAFAVHGTNRGCFATGRAQIGSGATNPPHLMRALRDTSHLVARDLCAAVYQQLSLDVESSSLRSVRQQGRQFDIDENDKGSASASLPVPPLADHTIQCQPPPSLTFRQIRACQASVRSSRHVILLNTEAAGRTWFPRTLPHICICQLITRRLDVDDAPHRGNSNTSGTTSTAATAVAKTVGELRPLGITKYSDMTNPNTQSVQVKLCVLGPATGTIGATAMGVSKPCGEASRPGFAKHNATESVVSMHKPVFNTLASPFCLGICRNLCFFGHPQKSLL